MPTWYGPGSPNWPLPGLRQVVPLVFQGRLPGAAVGGGVAPLGDVGGVVGAAPAGGALPGVVGAPPGVVGAAPVDGALPGVIGAPPGVEGVPLAVAGRPAAAVGCAPAPGRLLGVDTGTAGEAAPAVAFAPPTAALDATSPDCDASAPQPAATSHNTRVQARSILTSYLPPQGRFTPKPCQPYPFPDRRARIIPHVDELHFSSTCRTLEPNLTC
jgi:hypothetical protein